MYENRTKENERKAREVFSVNLRQQRREDLISKKRTTRTDVIGNENLRVNRDKILSSDLREILEGTFSIRKILSSDKTPPIDEVIRANILPRVVGFLSLSCPVFGMDNSEIVDEIRTESAWIITNIASGTKEQTESVVGLGAIKLLIDILGENTASIQLIDQAIWALGNIGGDNEVCRDIIIEHNGAPRIAELISHLSGGDLSKIDFNPHLKVLRNCSWLLSNLCRGSSPRPSFTHLKFCLALFEKLVQGTDDEIVNDSMWALSYIADADVLLAENVIQSGSVQRALTLLYTVANKGAGRPYDGSIINLANFCCSSSLRMIGNIMSGTNEQTEFVLSIGIDDSNILSILMILYYQSYDLKKLSRIRKEICWIISNIAAGSIAQVDALFQKSVHKLLLDALSNSEISIKTEACYAISNIVQHLSTSMHHYQILVSNDLVSALGSYLKACSNVSHMQIVVLNTLRSILEAGKVWGDVTGQGNTAISFFNYDIIGNIEELQDVKDITVNNLAYNIIVDFFEGIEHQA